MPPSAPASDACVGIIANPISARDIRRIITYASNLQTAERAHIVMRLLTTLHAMGVPRVLMMPDRAGLRAVLLRELSRAGARRDALPVLEFLDMEPGSTVEDSFLAARMMRAAGVKALIVLGGDGTHRAVVRECADVPIAGLSTGTNNAFPEMREPTVTALAVGLYATGRLSAAQALVPNKRLDISINGGERRDIALVDAVISTDRTIGARALWKTEHLTAAYLTFADPLAIGLSAIGGLLHPVDRRDPFGLAIGLCEDRERRRLHVQAPIAPGLMADVGIADWEPMPAGRPFDVGLDAGIVALDGERELPFERGERVQVTLQPDAFPTVHVSRCMQIAARDGLFHRPSRDD